MTQAMHMSAGEEEDSTREDARTLMEQGWEHMHQLEHEHEHEQDGDDKQPELHHGKTGRAHVTSIGSVSGSSVDSGSASYRRDAYTNGGVGGGGGSMKSATNPKDLGLNHGSKLQQDSKRTPAPDPISRLRSRPRPHPLHPQSQSQSQSSNYDSYTYPYPYPYPYPTASASATNLTTYPRINSNSSASPWILEEYTASPQIPSAPISPVSPRWDSLGRGTTATPHKHVAASTPNSPLARAFFNDQAHSHLDEEDELHLDDDSIASESRDEFPPLLPSKLNYVDGHSHVENFSRPRNLSNKQSYLESPRSRPLNHPQFDSIHHDGTGHPLPPWPRSRGPSISSNKSAATFASLPVRPPPEIYPRDSPRARGRQPQPPPTRAPIAYGRAESSGPPYIRDAIPRMASLPTEELRSSYRSQLSASTAQGTLGTERSSVLTKSSSLTSVDGPLDAIDTIDDVELIEDDEELVDDDFSLSDIMGIEVSYTFDAKESKDIESIKEPEDSTDTKGEEELISFDDDDKSDADDEEGDNTESIADARDIESIADTEVTEDMRRSEVLVDIEDVENTQDQNLGETKVDAAKDDEETKSAGDMADPEDAGEVVEEANGADADESAMGSAAVAGPDIGDDSKKEDDTTKENTNLTTTDDDGRDRYGFRKTNQYITREQYDTWNEGYTEYLERRRRKWVLFLKENGLMTDTPNRFPPRSAKAKRFVRKGIPPDWRGAAWFYYAGGPAILAKHAGLYDELLKRQAKDVDVEAIERDLHRTFPDNIKFRSCNPAVNTTIGPRNSQQTLREQLAGNHRPDETLMISSLRRVLHAFSVYNPRIGYCQSLNFLAGLLLLFVESEEHAFWLLNIITRVYLPGTHEMSLEGANVDLGVLMATLRESMPAVWAKIGGELDGTDVIRPRHRRLKQREQVRLPPITLCMTAWFMSCFIGTLPIETTLRVWDVFFYEGSKTLFRIALAIFKLGENEIRSVGDPMEIFQVVQTIPRRLINANGLMEACFKRRNGFGHLSQETIEQKRQERRNYVKAEKEKMALGDKAVTADIEATRKGTLFGRRRGS
ncbi:TBC domain-containing protein [Biscogniauxia sp. FL1348]|nr:TBC domain-containing protein [Biscogniauxia sp. FL1348]